MTQHLKIENLSKLFRVYETPKDRLVNWMTFGNAKRNKDIWVLKSINLSLKAGDGMAIQGRNGSGKSTLLKLVAGGLTPTKGTISRHGSLGAIIELGVGINEEASGEENAKGYYSRLIEPKLSFNEFLDRVRELADIGQYFEQPVKHYSSGMRARLAFAGSMAVRPDILLVDEALSVGDKDYQVKCLDLIHSYLDKGTSLLFVSHVLPDLDFIKYKATLKDGVLIDNQVI